MAADCPLFPDNPSHCDVIVAVKRTIASLSMVGSFFIIFIIWLFEKYKHFEQRLLLALSVAAFMSCISYLIGEDLHPEEGPVCVLQAWWLTFFNRCVILWVCCITFNIYWNLIKERQTRRFEKWYYVICWGVSLLISMLPFIDDHYGPAGPWCWIPRESSNSTVWRFMMWYVPLFVIITILFIVYGFIFYTYRKKVREWAGTYNDEQQRQKERLMKKVKSLLAYPCIYLVTSIFPLIHRIYNATTATPSFSLLLLHVIFNPLAGALNAIAYGCDKETLSKLLDRHNIRAAFLRHFRAAPVVDEHPTDPDTVVQGAENDAMDEIDDVRYEEDNDARDDANYATDDVDDGKDDVDDANDDVVTVRNNTDNAKYDESHVKDDAGNVKDDVRIVIDDADKVKCDVESVSDHDIKARNTSDGEG